MIHRKHQNQHQHQNQHRHRKKVIITAFVLTFLTVPLGFQASLLLKSPSLGASSFHAIAHQEELSHNSPPPPPPPPPPPSSKLDKDKDKDKNVIDDKDKDCPFRDSPIYRSIYVYPSPGDDAWQGDILSKHGRDMRDQNVSWPWIAIDKKSRQEGVVHYNTKSPAIQYNTELLVRDIITHPDSCLRTDDPETATLFYVPYLPSIEYHNGSLTLGDYKTSPFGQALMDATMTTITTTTTTTTNNNNNNNNNNKFNSWEQTFGLTSKFWKRRGGSDHILVMSEPLHGLWHPKSRRGSFHFVHSQKQLTPPIIISVELSTTFVQMHPHCARKNILMPYPNTDGKWFNGKMDSEALELFQNANLLPPSPIPIPIPLHNNNNNNNYNYNYNNVSQSPAALEAEKLIGIGIGIDTNTDTDTNTIPDNPRLRPRPLAQFYGAGPHGTCTKLRKSLNKDFSCSESGKLKKKNPAALKNYAHAYRQATFCPCPGGDSPSAKRMFDALHAGCIPLILSQDYVWPFTSEFDGIGISSSSGSSGSSIGNNSIQKNDTNNNKNQSISKLLLLNPDNFSLRLEATDYLVAKHDEATCKRLLIANNNTDANANTTTDDNDNEGDGGDIQAFMESISKEDIIRMRQGALEASDIYSYYRRSPGLPDNPLREGVLPDGGAAHALVAALSERAEGAFWPACEKELLTSSLQAPEEPRTFKC